MLTLPVKPGDSIEFTAHGRRYVVRKVDRFFSLWEIGGRSVRLGDRAKILKDIEHIQNGGTVKAAPRKW